jgi:hypothetical protein
MTLFSAIRCHHCGTYRLGGDPCDCRQKLPPVIIGEGDTLDQIRYAIRCVCGEDRVILSVQHCPQDLPLPWPADTQQYVVISESSECDHDPRCQWLDQVYWYRDRSVVVKMNEMHTTLLGNVIRQLKGE